MSDVNEQDLSDLDEEDALRSCILARLPPTSKVEFVYFERIATTADGKYEECVSEVVA